MYYYLLYLLGYYTYDEHKEVKDETQKLERTRSCPNLDYVEINKELTQKQKMLTDYDKVIKELKEKIKSRQS